MQDPPKSPSLRKFPSLTFRRGGRENSALLRPKDERIVIYLSFMNNPEKFLEMKKVLEKGVGKRSDSDIRYLSTFLKYNDFFFNLTKMKDKSTLDQCYRHISLEFFRASHFIFHWGQKGDKFYVILKGEVKVLIPKESTQLNKEEMTLENMIELKTLGVGSSFGELALFSNKPRTASILAKEDTFLAVLKKKDFRQILWGFEERKLINNINFFLDFYIFKEWTFPELREIIPKFFEKKYEKKSFVFKEEDPADLLYFIRDGQFKLTISDKSLKGKNSQFAGKEVNFCSQREKASKYHEIAIYCNKSMLGEEEALLLGYHQFNLECVEPGNVFTLNKNVLSFWEANEKKLAVLNQILCSAKEKLDHYNKRLEDISSRELLIYQNYESSKKLPKIASPLINLTEKNYFLKEDYHRKKAKIAKINSLSININDYNLKAPFSERSKGNFERKERNHLTEESRESLQSVYSALQNSESLRKIKEFSIYYKNLKEDIGKKQNIKRIFNKKSMNIMNECEYQLENKDLSSRISEISCYQFIVSKLAPKDHEEIKKKLRILQISRKKNTSVIIN